MIEIERMTDQLHRAFYGPAWHGPAVMVLLREVNAVQAASRPVNNAHTIWEIVNHLSAWKDAVRRRLLGENVQLDGEPDWPPMRDVLASDWEKTIEFLKLRHDELEKTVASLSESRLDIPWSEGKSTCYFLIHGSIQHDLYHTGQIAMLLRTQQSAK
jgi:uncharacterized damage-inducible protein DinB